VSNQLLRLFLITGKYIVITSNFFFIVYLFVVFILLAGLATRLRLKWKQNQCQWAKV
jgi:uncharacterized membrane protein